MRILFILFFLGYVKTAWCVPQYTLADLIDIARKENPILDVLEAKEDAAKYNVVTAES